ncbi:hypothetical protein Gotri_013614, partial [Gossypium trilobum]|nr:hypothetical protein [Gossypium trilobum]
MAANLGKFNLVGERWEQIVGIPPPCPTVGPDKVIWGSTSTGTFTLNSAYGKIREKSWNPKEAIWQLPWKFQDCPTARDIWKHIIPKDKEMSIGNAFLGSLCGVFGEIVTFSHFKVTKIYVQPNISPSSFYGNWIYSRTNGVVKVDRGFVVVGRVLRDRSERWIIGIKDGLKLLLERNFDSVLIQTNSMEAINAIQEQASSGSELALVRRIHQLLSIIEYWTTRHIPREYNKKANGIAKAVQERREDYKYSRLPFWE